MWDPSSCTAHGAVEHCAWHFCVLRTGDVLMTQTDTWLQWHRVTVTALILCSPKASPFITRWRCSNTTPYFIFQKYATGFDIIYSHTANRYFKFELPTKDLRVLTDLVYKCNAGGYPLSELHLMDGVFNSGILPLWDDVIIQRVCYCLRILILRFRLIVHTC
jgi:hypothetical protein